MEQNAGEHQDSTEKIAIACKWYLNGFPKSGLHYAATLISPLAKPAQSDGPRTKPWAGTFEDHSWTTRWQNLKKQMYHMSNDIAPGFYLKGHCGWTQNIEAFLWSCGFCHVFVYRDPRDVAVSTMYHILSDEEKDIHPGKQKFKLLGNKSSILSAVILGLDEYAGVMERWALYAPWLSIDWVYKFRYEEVRTNPMKAANSLIYYGLARLGEIFELNFDCQDSTDELVRLMVGAAEVGAREKLYTFRAGRIGDWRQEFNAEHKELFKQTDKNNWLIRLGYEKDQNW